KTLNRALAQARAPVERGIACLKSQRIFHKSRCSPTHMTSTAKAIPTLEHHH
ncbi:IS5/IS1182 family transposase, partial [Streptomyces sp. NPDC002306]